VILRVLRTAKATLSRTFYLDEVETLPTGSVAVSVTRLDGSVVEGGNASGPDVNGAFSYTFAGRDVLDELVVSWSVTLGGDAVVLDQDTIEVVGGFYFSLAEGRDSDPVLSSTQKYPTSKLAAARMEVETECERITGQAWVPRFRRATVSGTGREALVLPDTMVRAVRSVSADGIAYASPSVAGLAFSDVGMLSRPAGYPWPRGSRNVVVEYEHGNDRPNSDILRAAKLRFKSLVMEGKSSLPDRAERTVTVDANGSSTIYGSPTADKTGIPAVDAGYGRWPAPSPGFG
jgi:hypothetical protein